MSSSSSKDMITLRSNDAMELKVAEEVAFQSKVLQQLVEGVDCAAAAAIPLHNVSGKILEKVVEYCEKHAEKTGMGEGDLKKWDEEFMNKTDTDTLHDLILAANYLELRGLLDLACQTVADMIKGKMPEEIRKMFDIENDFTSEEEEEIRSQNPWAFA